MRAAEGAFANPGGLHGEGVAAKKLLEDARGRIARQLGAKSRQIVFTSGLTESNNLAILGFARKIAISGISLGKSHWVTSSIEHASVLECFGEIERLGGKVSFVDPDPRGLISPEMLARAIRPNTVFISVGWANNEIGVVQPLAALSRTVHKAGSIVFHSDAGQAPLYLSPQVHTLGVNMLSLGSGKLFGPRGVGALYVRDPDEIAALILGGGQERGLRAGTEKVVPACGFAAAFEAIAAERDKETKRVRALRDKLAAKIVANVPGALINGSLKHMLPNMLNISIPHINSEYLVLALDRAGLALSTKAACSEGSNNESHVVGSLAEAQAKAAGTPIIAWRASNTLRISLGRDTSASDIKRAMQILVRVVKEVQAVS